MRSLTRGTLSAAPFIVAMGLCSTGGMAHGQWEANYDESKVRVENLPPLLQRDGERIDRSEEWAEHREYLVDQLAQWVYGTAPDGSVETNLSEISNHTLAGDDQISVKQFDLKLSREGKQCVLQVTTFTPKEGEPIGMFLMPNFKGTHALVNDAEIRITPSLSIDNPKTKAKEQPVERGSQDRRLPVDMICGEGFGLATVCYYDIDPDFHDGFENGVHALFPEHVRSEQHPERWGSIAAWAWGLTKIREALSERPEFEDLPWAVIGHSRLGKTALWAGATDPKFTIVYSNDSGCGGAALGRRNFGETPERITSSFPHWFNGNYMRLAKTPEKLPVDQHMLIASIAPRPVYVASATEDLWADPKGEWESAKLASEAYEMLGLEGLTGEMPPPGQSVGDDVGYHIRAGKHDLLAEDWSHYLRFAKEQWQSAPVKKP